jgi:hypothetical protein
MKKNLLPVLFAVCFISASASAQKTRFGINAGVSLANLYAKEDGQSQNGKSKAGLIAGVMLDVPISSHFSFQTGLNFVQKGTTDEAEGVDISAKINVNYLELPAYLVFKSNPTPTHFFVGAGPYLAYAVTGRISATEGGVTSSESIPFGNDEASLMKRFDAGIGFLTGVDFKNNMRLAVNYSLGLSNINPDGAGPGTLKNGAFGITIGYFLK